MIFFHHTGPKGKTFILYKNSNFQNDLVFLIRNWTKKLWLYENAILSTIRFSLMQKLNIASQIH